MRRVRPNPLLWGAMTAAIFLIFGCATTAYKQYLVAQDDYERCVKRHGDSHDRCVAEREKLRGILGTYEREAEGNQWWRNAIEDVRDKEPLSPFDRK